MVFLVKGRERIGKAVLGKRNPKITCENIMEGRLHVGRVQGRRLNETEVVLLGKSLRLICWHCAQVAQVRLVPHLQSKITFLKCSLINLL